MPRLQLRSSQKWTGMPFRHVRQLSGGETGAHQFLEPDGQPIVVKWDTSLDGRAFRGEAVVLQSDFDVTRAGQSPAESVIDSEEVSSSSRLHAGNSAHGPRSWTD